MKNRFKDSFNRIKYEVRRRPMVWFFASLGLLLALIVMATLIRRPAPENGVLEAVVHPVNTYKIGSVPLMRFEGKVEKTGVVTVVAQNAGVVQRTFVTEGQAVSQGKTLVSLSTSYSGGNIAQIQAKLARTQYQYNQENKDKQKELIDKQKQLAEKSQENSEELRRISRESLADTRDQLNLNESILESIEDNLQTLEEATASAQNDALILSTKQLKSQFLSATNQIRGLLRQNEYQAADDRPPAELAALQQDLTLGQLELQEKALNLQEEISRLNYQLALVSASLMAPQAPFGSVVERVWVKPGQFVSPGTPLVSLAGNHQTAQLVVSLPHSLATLVSQIQPSRIFLPSGDMELSPQYVTQEPLSDGLNRVIFNLPALGEALAEGSYVRVDVPIGYANTAASFPSVPLDAVRQLQDSAYVLTANGNVATSKPVTLGNVYGAFVEVLSGLQTSDLLILNRSVVDGDLITLE